MKSGRVGSKVYRSWRLMLPEEGNPALSVTAVPRCSATPSLGSSQSLLILDMCHGILAGYGECFTLSK